jgi:hypothetical protein
MEAYCSRKSRRGINAGSEAADAIVGLAAGLITE